VPEIQDSGVKDLPPVKIQQEGNPQIRGGKGRDPDAGIQLQRIPRGHALSPGADGRVGGDNVADGSGILPGENNGIHMVNVLVGDKDENLSVGQKLLGRNLIVSLQLMLLAPPVIKDKKKIILFDGKAAVIVMRDFDW
jgi:hypothetical protein